MNVNYHHLDFNENFEKFDTSNFNSTKTDTIVKNNDTIIRYRYSRTYFERHTKNNFSKEYSLFKDHIDDDEYFKDSIFAVHKEFYVNGNIKTKGIRCLLGFYTGLWYEYSHNGKLTKIVNYDKDYLFNTDDVLYYCFKNNISLSISTLPQTSINKHKTHNGKHVWIVIYNVGNMSFKTITLDGKTGNILLKSSFTTIE